MTTIAPDIVIEHDAELPTWFGIGGRADRLARPETPEQLIACLQADPKLHILGDGANLLVDDDGVGDLVVSLQRLNKVELRSPGIVYAEAGANLPKMILECVRQGLRGVEGLGGIPATIGGAVFMNAGGAFGQIGEVVERVHVLERDGTARTLRRGEIKFAYRHSGLGDGRDNLVITAVEFALKPDDPIVLRQRLKEVMAYKKDSQPMAERSAGCAFKNPTLAADLPGAGVKGSRISAGRLIDMAGCKGLRIGGAHVSERHANFIVTVQGGRARDVIELMDEITRRVHDQYGVNLEPEVVVWRR